jgi:hypothetical protein
VTKDLLGGGQVIVQFTRPATGVIYAKCILDKVDSSDYTRFFVNEGSGTEKTWAGKTKGIPYVLKINAYSEDATSYFVKSNIGVCDIDIGTPGLQEGIPDFILGDIAKAFIVNDNTTEVASGQLTGTAASTALYPKYGIGPCGIRSAESVKTYLTNTINNSASGNSITLSLPNDRYGYVAIPDTVSTSATFTSGFTGGWDGATWNCPPGDELFSQTGPLAIKITTSGEAHTWYLYRTDFPGLGSVSYKISYP